VTVCGLDPSFTKSGISNGKITELMITKPSNDASALGDTIRRAREIAVGTRLFMLRSKAKKLYCEAPMVGPNANHLYEVGILMCILAGEIGLENIVLVTPSTLKKFMTGHGDAPSKHTQCQAPRKNGSLRPLCVACGTKALHGIEFEGDKGLDKLHGWGLAEFGRLVEAGKLEHTQPARRGKGKAKVAKHNALIKRKARKVTRSGSTRKASVPDVRVSKRGRSTSNKTL
jgi:hypothetical protein